jgi:hypothetical protein
MDGYGEGGEMFHQGFAGEFARVLAKDRVRDGRPPLDRAHVPGSPLDRLLSLGGALALLALVLFGAVGVAVLTIAIGSVLALVAAGVGPRRDEPTPPGPESRDRWRAWRVHEPDPEYLRGRAA